MFLFFIYVFELLPIYKKSAEQHIIMPMQMKKAFASDILGKAEYAIIIMITERPNNAMSVEALILSIYIFFF